MFSMSRIIKSALYPKNYIWVNVTIIKETQKALLIEFDGRTAWFPKAWIARIKPQKCSKAVKIKISQYRWTKKFI